MASANCKSSSHYNYRHLIPHTEVLTKIEPYIIRLVPEFQADRLNQVATFYIRI
jgi:hypothetical protein